MPVAEPRRTFGGFAERPVEGGGVFGRIAHDERILESSAVKRPADRLDHSIHHAAGCDDVGAGASLGHGCFSDELQGCVIIDVSPFRMPQWPWDVVFAKTEIGDQEDIRDGFLKRSEGFLDNAAGRVRLAS